MLCRHLEMMLKRSSSDFDLRFVNFLSTNNTMAILDCWPDRADAALVGDNMLQVLEVV